MLLLYMPTYWNIIFNNTFNINQFCFLVLFFFLWFSPFWQVRMSAFRKVWSGTQENKKGCDLETTFLWKHLFHIRVRRVESCVAWNNGVQPLLRRANYLEQRLKIWYVTRFPVLEEGSLKDSTAATQTKIEQDSQKVYFSDLFCSNLLPPPRRLCFSRRWFVRLSVCVCL